MAADFCPLNAAERSQAQELIGADRLEQLLRQWAEEYPRRETRTIRDSLLRSLCHYVEAATTPAPEPLDLIAMFIENVALLRPATPAVVVEHPDHCVIHADAAMLQILLHELIDNAIRHAMHRAEIRLELGSRPGCSLYLRDNGCGIDPAQGSTVCLPFRSIAPPHRERTPAQRMGLGLATASRIAAVHGGHIRIASEPGWGTTVSVLLAPLRSA
jgi:signal transduction histidine kinase